MYLFFVIIYTFDRFYIEDKTTKLNKTKRGPVRVEMVLHSLTMSAKHQYNSTSSECCIF